MMRSESSTPCPNMNHKRADPPVGHCPNCGAVVNAALPPRRCIEAEHAAARRTQMRFCIHCGQRLIAGI